jgi:hypothetical protein
MSNSDIKFHANKVYSLLITLFFCLLLPYYTFQDMRLVDAAQRYLGTFDEWPADILDILFIQYPLPRMLRKLLAFLFGNGAPCCLAF